MVDFADLEHMAVRLLVGEDGAPTELARQWSARYDEIMVDEYQDTNEVQNTIFQALSQGGRNLFLVGDVKQSIYRFRLAGPHHLSGEVPDLPPLRPGRGGGEPADHPVQKLPLPPPGAGGRPTTCSVTSCPASWGRWTIPTRRPSTPEGPSRKGRGTRRSTTCWTSPRTPPSPRTSRTVPSWRPGSWPGRLPGFSGRGSPSPTAMGHPAPPAGGCGHSPALPLGRCAATTPRPWRRQGWPGPPRRGATSLPPPRSPWPCPGCRSSTTPTRTSPCWRFSAPPWWG